ncbi:hypothetical protein [Streptomyces triculaminicus]|uniref:hypothetical protein n=1 Tax=Streptomyces triculaminicus TaxID=2816232 RepID=UPI0037D16AB5
MSAVAAPAALLVHPRSELIDNSVDGASRRRLRSVPAQAGPASQLELGNPLLLTPTMRARLLAAVRALASDPALDGAGDPARLAAVVLMAKAKVAADYSTEITAKELGRWVGLKTSRIAHKVLPELRERGVLRSNETTGATGRTTGLQCWVIPMYRAQHGGDRRHVLALSRVELIVLLALIEALFAPGWTHKDGRVTPAGMLADRTGRGAATDRLGLLLMVLSSNSKGWLQLCSGSVDTGRGRPAATAGRLLGCSPAAGAKVLSRLQAQGVLTVDRRETASGLNARSRVRLLPVAQAHGVLVREAHKATDPGISDLAVSASGDHDAAGEAVAPVVAGEGSTGEGDEAGSADLAVAAPLHASHAPVVTPGGSLSLSRGYSGEGRGQNRGLPDRACVREDDGPLRGEQPKKSPVVEGGKGRRGPVADVSVRAVAGAGQGRHPQRRVPLPPEDLRAVLAPVESLWACLERRYTRRLVEKTARRELAAVAGVVGRVDAAGVLADRLTRRLAAQGGPTAVEDPVAWLVARGLPKRQMCGDVRCDEGLRMDTGGPCETCAYLVGDRRAQGQAIAAAVEAQMPRASESERRAEAERRLHQAVTAEGWGKARERQWLEAQRAALQARARESGPASVGPANPAAVPVAVPVVLRAPRPVEDAMPPESEPQDVGEGEAPLVLEELTRQQVIDWRARAERDHQLVLDHIDEHGELSARRLFTSRFVDQVLRLVGTRHLVLGHTAWGQA